MLGFRVPGRGLWARGFGVLAFGRCSIQGSCWEDCKSFRVSGFGILGLKSVLDIGCANYGVDFDGHGDGLLFANKQRVREASGLNPCNILLKNRT